MTNPNPEPTAITTTRPNPGFNDRGIELRSFDDVARLAQAISRSGLAPRSLQNPEAIAVAILTGVELGLSPMQSLQSICVINGRTAVFGDCALALVRGSGHLESFAESFEGEGEERAAVCRVRRRGEPEHLSRFSIADAKRANLWASKGPWTQYPQRMLRFRARGFALRDVFGDVLLGLSTAEEVSDYAGVPRAEAAAVIDAVATEVEEPTPVSDTPTEPITVPIDEPVPPMDGTT